MAEIWPRLRKKLQRKSKGTKSSSNKNSRKSSKAAANPYASMGMEKFATLLEEIQTKQQAATSLVERTASSLSAARCISRSAQEWTASTLVRTASRCSPDGTKLSQCAPPVDAAPTASDGELQRESENLSEERQPQRCHEEASSSNSASPLSVRLPTRRCRSVTSKSAFVMLVALGAFLSSRAGKFVKPLAAVLTLSVVVRIWRKGKVSARFMFQSVALYFLSPLQSYLITRIPKRLILVPHNFESSQNAESEVAQPELRAPSAIPVAAPALLPIPASSPSSKSLNPVMLLDARNVAGSPSRRLAKRISSRLKKLKMFRSSSPSVAVLSISESSSSSTATASSSLKSSNHRRKCPFSRKTGDIAESQACESTTSSSSHDGSRTSSHHGSRNKCRLMRRQQSSENLSCSNNKVSPFGRMSSSEMLEQYDQVGEDYIASAACESKHPSSSSASVGHEAAPVAWPVVGLLVMLLFLVVGRVPAIMATSLFFVVVSPHSRARDRRESRANWEAAVRKLHRSPPPRGGRRAISPPPRRL